MNMLVVYHSKTGFTEKYAKWIAESLNCKAIRLKEYKPQEVSSYDIVIYGGGIMAGRISGLGKIKQSIGNKKLVVFTTGATTKDALEVIERIRKDNFTQEESGRIPFFYFESGINYERMGFLPKNMLKMMYNSLKKKENRTPEEQGMMEALSASNDHSNKEYIRPLIDKVKEMGGV